MKKSGKDFFNTPSDSAMHNRLMKPFIRPFPTVNAGAAAGL